MELSSSPEDANYAATQEPPRNLLNRRIITLYTRALHRWLSKARTIQSTLHNLKISLLWVNASCLFKIQLIFSTYLCLGLPSGLFPSGFPINNIYTSLFSPIRATCPAKLILLDLIIPIILGEEYKLRSS
jgi:hypothetical protein